MAYTLDQWKQLPGLENLTSLDDLAGMQDQLSGYRALNIGDNTGGIFDALSRNSYDFGDQRLIKSDVADYYNRLSAAATKAGATNLGVNLNYADPLSGELFDFDPNKWQIPVARFGETAGAQDMRYIPYELATELGALNGNVYGINDFFGNRGLFEKGQLTLLPDEYASKIAQTDWAGTDYNWENPNLGFVMPSSVLGELYSAYGNQGAPDLEGRAITSRDLSGAYGTSGGVFDFGRNAALTDFAGHGMKQVTPELRALLNDRALGHYELGSFLDPRRSEEYMNYVQGYALSAATARQAFSDADWYINNPNNPFDMLLVDAERPDWFYRPLMQTDASMKETAQQAADWNQSNQSGGWFSDLLSNVGPLFAAGVLGVMGGGVLDSFGGAGNLFGTDIGAIGAGDASAAMGSGIDAAGWGASSLDPLGTSFLDSALSSAGDYLTNPNTYIKSAVAGGGDLEKSLENLATGAVTGGLTGGLQDLTHGLTGSVITDSALANAAATGVMTGDLTSAAASGLGSAASGFVGAENIGGANSILDQVLPTIAGQTVAGTTMTGDLGSSLGNAVANTGINVAGNLVGSTVSGLTQDTGIGSAIGAGANQLTQGALQGALSSDPPSTTTVLPTTINDPVTTGTAPTTPVDTTPPTDSGSAASSSSGLSSLLPLMALGVAGQDQPTTTQISDDSSPAALPAFQPTNLFDTSRYFGAPTKQLREGGKVMQRYDEGGGVNLSDYGFTNLNTGSDYNLGSSNQGYEAFYDLLNQADTGLGSGYYGLDDALTSGAGGYDYNTPFSSGSITGLSGLGSTSGLYDYLNSIGADTTYLDSVGGSSTGSSESSGLDYNGILRALLGNRSSGSAQSTQGGVSNLLRSVGLGGAAGSGLGALALVLANRAQNNNQASANANALAGAKPAWSTAPLQTRAMSAPTARNAFTGAPIQRASGGLTRMLGSNNAGPAMGYVDGGSAGQADEVPALLSDGEYVLDADIVSALGDGNNAAGAAVLDQMREEIRRHKRSAPPSEIPSPAKTPQQYLQGVE